MLAKLQRLWLIEADEVQRAADRRPRRASGSNPDLAGRPTLIRGNSQLFFPGMGRLSENSVVSIKNKSFSVTAEVEVPDGGADGRDHRPGRPLRRLGRLRQGRQGRSSSTTCSASTSSPTEADAPIPAGTHQVRMEFAYDGGGLAKGGDVTLYYDGDAGRAPAGSRPPSR